MTILIDSAIIPDVTECFHKYPWVKGLSTNPKLLALAAKNHSPKAVLGELADLTSGLFFYQVTATHEKDLISECQEAKLILGKRLVIKIMPSENNYAFTHKFQKDYDFCFTAVHNLTQAILAYEAGAKYIAVYVNRMLKAGLKPYDMMAQVCRKYPNKELQILAASIKSLSEFEDTVLSGAHMLTLPYFLFEKLPQHDMTLRAAQEFEDEGRGIL